MSNDGRFVVLSTYTALVGSDTNDDFDIYVRDHATGTTDRVSVAADGGDPDAPPSAITSISGDGRYVLFSSRATNLLSAGSTPPGANLFIRDRSAHTTTMVNITSDGLAPNDVFGDFRLSANGRVVMFGSSSSNIMPGAILGKEDVYVHDLDTATTERINVASGGAIANQESFPSGLSGDGNIVAFKTKATNLASVSGGFTNVFVRDRSAHTTQLVNVAIGGGSANEASSTSTDSVSTDGRYILFQSVGDNLTNDDTPLTSDLFVRDLKTSTTARAKATTGVPPPFVMQPIGLSDDGRFVLGLGYRVGLTDQQSYVIDRVKETLSFAGTAPAQLPLVKGSNPVAISPDGAYVLFTTPDPTLVGPNPTGERSGAFLRSTVVPTISAASPASAPAGSTRIVTLTGTYLFGGPFVSFGAGVTVTNKVPVDEQHMQVTIKIAANAEPGPRTIVYQNAGTGVGPRTGGLTVLVNGFTVA